MREQMPGQVERQVDRRGDRSAELADKTKAFLTRARDKGLVTECKGSLFVLLNDIAHKALDGKADEGFVDELHEFGKFYNDPETQAIMPFFGIEVTQADSGEVSLVFAD